MKTTNQDWQKEANELLNGKRHRGPRFDETTIHAPEPEEGEPLEQKIDRIMDEKSPLTDGAPLIYDTGQEYNPDYDIRADHMELAQDRAQKILENRRGFFTKREEEAKAKKEAEEAAKAAKTNGETES